MIHYIGIVSARPVGSVLRNDSLKDGADCHGHLRSLAMTCERAAESDTRSLPGTIGAIQYVIFLIEVKVYD